MIDDFRSNTDLARAYRVLGVERTMSDAEIKLAYRDLVSVWHPDRFGHDPRLRAKADEQLKTINAAFHVISTDRARRAPNPARESAPPTPAGQTDGGVRWRCPDCNSAVTEGDPLCWKCGRKLTFEDERPVSRTGWRCPDCGSEVTKGARRCRKCGRKLIFDTGEKWRCSACGAPVEVGAKRCGSCRAWLEFEE